MTMAATTSAIIAKIRIALVNWSVNPAAALASALASWPPVCTASAERPGMALIRATSAACDTPGRARATTLVVARPARHLKCRRGLEGKHRGIAVRMVDAEIDGADQAVTAHRSGLADHPDALAQPEMLVSRGARVGRGLARRRGQPPGGER